jgi:transposase
MKKIRYVGLDVHAETIAVAVAEGGRDGEVRSLGTIANRIEPVRKLVNKLREQGEIRVCYEAGPTGYCLYWQLTQLEVECEVIAPSLIPVKASERVKTDRRDAEKLARCYRAGELTAVAVPSPEQEALRDLVRAREAATKDQLKARHRLGKFLLRHGRKPDGMKAWTKQYLEWIKTNVRFPIKALEVTLLNYLHEVEHVAARVVHLEAAIDEAVREAPAELRAVIEALQALRGVAQTTAATIVSELGLLQRFASPRQLMGYSGLVASEHSSGGKVQRGAITKSGNAHLRRVLVEASWSYHHRPNVTGLLLRRQKNLGLSDEVKAIAWKAQHRLNKRYKALTAKGKNKNQVVTALARELLGFIWAIAAKTETKTLAAGQGGMEQPHATPSSSVGPGPRLSRPSPAGALRAALTGSGPAGS